MRCFQGGVTLTDIHIAEKPHVASVSLHWIGAVLALTALLGGLYIGYYAKGCCSAERRLVFLAHAYAGLSVLVVAVARLTFRAAFSWPEPLDETHGKIGTAVAAFVHFSLYAIMILIPLTGWIMASAMPCCWGVPGLPDVRVLSFGIGNPTMAGFTAAYQIHVTLAWITIGLILLHVMAALVHHLHLRNDKLRGMLPGRLRNKRIGAGGAPEPQ